MFGYLVKRLILAAFTLLTILLVSYGAEVRFSGTSIVQVRLVLRAYTLTTQTLSVLPPAQAAAILPEGSALRLVYSDTSAGITAGWQS